MRPGPTPKPDDQTVHRNPLAVLPLELPDDDEVVDAELMETDDVGIPSPPAGLSPSLLSDWRTFWTSPLANAGAVHTTDLPALHRLFLLREGAMVAQNGCDFEPFVTGSKDQLVANPQCKQAAGLRKEILALEDRFGLNPQARLRLVGHDQNNALTAAVRRRLEAGEPPQEEGTARADPRLALPDPAASVRRWAGSGLDGGEPPAR